MEREWKCLLHFFPFLYSTCLNKGMNERTSADDLLFAGSSLSISIEIIFKDHLISNIITHGITAAMSVDVSVAQ